MASLRCFHIDADGHVSVRECHECDCCRSSCRTQHVIRQPRSACRQQASRRVSNHAIRIVCVLILLNSVFAVFGGLHLSLVPPCFVSLVKCLRFLMMFVRADFCCVLNLDFAHSAHRQCCRPQRSQHQHLFDVAQFLPSTIPANSKHVCFTCDVRAFEACFRPCTAFALSVKWTTTRPQNVRIWHRAFRILTAPSIICHTGCCSSSSSPTITLIMRVRSTNRGHVLLFCFFRLYVQVSYNRCLFGCNLRCDTSNVFATMSVLPTKENFVVLLPKSGVAQGTHPSTACY